ncbi:hypothetical protein CCAX7_000390 [Capsulimonas corticalis]|uniref:Uncharacterized protein n=1 Tax=Capsulimonas corticalis TaxID=2219043 RepID=A0A402CR62_9BACT|nr:hypothetical protein [Capsulimonas corticalis]BDI27988.1 hypothetical protein CCAX7_000390 [Capsulimonas corticalis]
MTFKDNSNHILSMASNIAALAASVLGLVYGLGFFVCSVYLSSLGAVDFVLLKPRYIAVGITAMIIMLGSYVAQSCYFEDKLKKAMSDKAIPKVILKIIYSWLLWLVLELILLSFFTTASKLTWHMYMLKMLAFVIAIPTVFVWIDNARSNNTFHWFVSYLHVFTVGAGLIVLYSRTIFPLIPAAYGGGALPEVQLICTHEGSTILASALPMTSAQSLTTNWVQLIDEDDKAVLIRVRDQTNHGYHVLRLDRSLFNVIVYKP